MTLLDLGQKPAQIARVLGCDVSSNHRWRRALRAGGSQALTALVEKKPRAPKLDARKRAWIRQTLTKAPIWRAVRSLGFSPQRPQRRMRQHDVTAIEAFRRER